MRGLGAEWARGSRNTGCGGLRSRPRSRREGAGLGGILSPGLETYLDGRIMNVPSRIRRTLVNIVAGTGATTCAEVAAQGLAALSAVWRVLLGSNFHSSHLPRPTPPILAPPPKPRWKSPTTCLLLRREGKAPAGVGRRERRKEPCRQGPPPPAATTAALPDSQERGMRGREEEASLRCAGPRQGTAAAGREAADWAWQGQGGGVATPSARWCALGSDCGFQPLAPPTTCCISSLSQVP